MKIRFFNIFFTFLILLLVFFSQSCKKDSFTTSGNLNFSVDTLIFDTIFTTVGSTTQQFKVYNNNNQAIKIDEVKLMGGSASPFRINFDGQAGLSFTEIELAKNDSLFVFVEVTLGVNGQNLPLIIEDSILFKANGKSNYVKLAVWGQDAYFHVNEILSPIQQDTTWSNDKPHVVYNYIAIDSAKTLNIDAGTQIHLHKNSIFYNYKGALNVNGEKDNEVVFQGDRLESFYDDVAGQWYGLYFQEALPSKINYAIIKNGTAGIHTYSEDQSNPSYTLEITNTIIINHASYGVFSYSGSKIKMENSLIARCERNGFLQLEGGDFYINHCHILNYSTSKEANYAFAVKNYFTQNGVTNVGSVNEGRIINSLIYGGQEDELVLDTINVNGQVNLSFEIRNCHIRNSNTESNLTFINNSWNLDPIFLDLVANDFHFSLNSPLNGNADAFYTLPKDLDGNNRSNSAPDIGCYELN